MRQRQVVLVLGVPRSGSTWLTDILSSAPDTDMVMEPDNEKTSLLASILKKRLPRFPVLSRQEQGPLELQWLWNCAFTSNLAPLLSRGRLSSAACACRRASRESAIAAKTADPRVSRYQGSQHRMLRAIWASPAGQYRSRRIIKSVHASLYPEWIVERCQPSSTVIIMRHPLAVLQSWRRMNMPDAFRLANASGNLDTGAQENVFARMAEQLALMYTSLNAAAARNPGWQTVWHEGLCEDPAGQMREVADRCGIGWDAAMERRVDLMNQDGDGYQPKRNAVMEIGKWKAEVTKPEIEVARAIFARSGMADLI